MGKPQVSHSMRRLGIAALGAAIAAIGAIAKALEDSPTLSWAEIVAGAGAAILAYAVKFAGDYSPGEVEAAVQVELVRWLGNGGSAPKE